MAIGLTYLLFVLFVNAIFFMTAMCIWAVATTQKLIFQTLWFKKRLLYRRIMDTLKHVDNWTYDISTCSIANEKCRIYQHGVIVIGEDNLASRSLTYDQLLNILIRVKEVRENKIAQEALKRLGVIEDGPLPRP